jgi:hypothetical protein
VQRELCDACRGSSGVYVLLPGLLEHVHVILYAFDIEDGVRILFIFLDSHRSVAHLYPV